MSVDPSDENLEQSVVNICCHCSTPYLTLVKDEMSTQDSMEALKTVLKLNYLNAFNSNCLEPVTTTTSTDLPNQEMEGSFCFNCNQLLVNLLENYNQFIQVAQLDSVIMKKLYQLDLIIKSHQNRLIYCDLISNDRSREDPNNLTKVVQTHFNDSQSSSSKQGLKETEKNVETNSTNDLHYPELKIMLTRLPEKYLKQEETLTHLNPNEFEDDEWNSPAEDDDTSFDEDLPRPKIKIKISKKIKKEVDRDEYLEDSEKSSDDSTSTPTTQVVVTRKSGRKGQGQPVKSLKSNSFVEEKVEKIRKVGKKSLKIKGELDIDVKKMYHYLRRKTAAPNPCWYCRRRDFATPADCFAHTRSEHLPNANYRNAVICSRCSKICPDTNYLNSHLKRCELIPIGEILPKTFECKLCSKSFATLVVLKKHQVSHQTDRPYECDVCPYTTKTSGSLVKHKKFQHCVNQEEIQVQCTICGKILKNEDNLRMHNYYTHTPEGQQKYRAKQLLRTGKKRNKNKDKKEGIKGTNCEDCQIDCFSRLSLINHRRDFHGDNMGKQHICDLCGRDFTTAYTLKTHLKRHSDERPFICELCGKGFKVICNLKAHYDHTHTEEGRIRYNEKTREKNRRKKLLTSQLANLGLGPGPQT